MWQVPAPTPCDFASQLASLETWVRSLDPPQLKPWRRVEVVEDQLSQSQTPDWDSGVPPEDFRHRWAVITATVDRDWIKLHAEGVRGETLIVSVEWYASDDPNHRRQRPVSANFSGPFRGGPGWNHLRSRG
jgi:hypothetical protein